MSADIIGTNKLDLSCTFWCILNEVWDSSLFEGFDFMDLIVVVGEMTKSKDKDNVLVGASVLIVSVISSAYALRSIPRVECTMLGASEKSKDSDCNAIVAVIIDVSLDL